MIAFSGLNRHGALWLGFFGLILAAWAGLFAMVLSSPLADVPPGLWAAICLSAEAASLPALFAMWALMAGAMMLPTFAPAFHTFLNLGATGATNPREAAALVAGYALIMLGGAAIGALAQMALLAGRTACPGWLQPFGLVDLRAADRLRHLSVFETETHVPLEMPDAADLLHGALETGHGSGLPDGGGTGRALPWLLLGADGAGFCGRLHEPPLDGGGDALYGTGKTAGYRRAIDAPGRLRVDSGRGHCRSACCALKRERKSDVE